MLDPREMMNTIEPHANLALIMTFVEYKPVPAFSPNSTVSKINNLHPQVAQAFL